MHRLDNEINDLKEEIKRLNRDRKRQDSEIRNNLAVLASIDSTLEQYNHELVTLMEDRNDDAEHGCVDCRCAS